MITGLLQKVHRYQFGSMVLMSKVEDYEAKYVLPKGIIALQLHSGEPMRVEFKDLRIRQY